MNAHATRPSAARALLAGVLGLLVVACASVGPGTTAGPGSSAAAGSPGAPSGAGQATPRGDAEPGDLSDALELLTAHDSWTFETSFIAAGLDDAVEWRQSGTERRSPERAIDLSVEQDTGDFRYIRIGDTIWSDVGVGFSESQAPQVPNLVAQYEPNLIEGLWSGPKGVMDEMLEIGPDQVAGQAAIHYQVDPDALADLLEFYGDVDAQAFGSEAWVAADGGHLLKLVWGPQAAAAAHRSVTGFVHEVTAVDCTCPVEPPE